MPRSLQAQGAVQSRVLVLDFIRLAALLLMIQGHTLDALVNPRWLDPETFHWRTWMHLRGLTAPLFLMVSGAATVLGLRYEADGRLVRGVLRRRLWTAFKVMGLGYLLVFPAARIIDLPWVSLEVWQGFLQVNILQANGATLLLLTGLLACVRTLRHYVGWSLGLGLLVVLASPWVYAVDWFRWLPEGLAAFLSFRHGSGFPLFPASGFMFLGVGLGAVLMESPPDLRLRRFRLASLTACVAFLLLGLATERLPQHLFPAHDPHMAGYAYTCLRLGFAFLLLGLLAWVAEGWPRLVEAVAPMGRKSLPIYLGHLILLFGLPWTGGLATERLHQASLVQGWLYVGLVGGATFGAVLLWKAVMDRTPWLGQMLGFSAALALFALIL